MGKEELKKVSSEVTNDCLKKLKITAIQKEITLSDLVGDILEKYVSKKTLETIEG